MFIERLTLALAVNGSGVGTIYSEKAVSGRVLQVRYVPDATKPLDTNTDLTITGEETGVAIATLASIGLSAFTKAIRQPTQILDGTAALFAAGGTTVNEPVYLANERIKVVVADGGVSMTGTLHVLIG